MRKNKLNEYQRKREENIFGKEEIESEKNLCRVGWGATKKKKKKDSINKWKWAGKKGRVLRKGRKNWLTADKRGIWKSQRNNKLIRSKWDK